MVDIKPGVKFDKIAPAGAMILQAIRSCSDHINQTLTITSGTDGEHSGENDPHHRGEAYDVRSNNIHNKDYVLSYINSQLGPDFYGFLEDADTPNEHFHFQIRKGVIFDPIKFLLA